MENDSKIKPSVSSHPCEVWGNFFHKKALHGAKMFLGKFFGGMFYMGTNDLTMQEEKLMVKRYQWSSQVSFSSY